MRFPNFFRLLLAAGLFQMSKGRPQIPAQSAQTSEVQQLQKQVLELRAEFQKLQAQHASELADVQLQLETHQQLLLAFQRNGTTRASSGTNQLVPATAGQSNPASPFPTPETFDAGASRASPPRANGAPVSTPFPTSDPTVTVDDHASGTSQDSRLTNPITVAGGAKTYLNLSFDGIFIGAISSTHALDRLEVGDHDPQQRGFNARNLELALDGAVDPYFDGFANIVFKLDSQDGTGVEVEEAFLQTKALPGNLQIKGGQFFAPFGRINSQHPHTWDFVDAPLAQGRLLGPDGLRGVGLQASWLTPLPWFSQVSLAAQNGRGGTGYSFRNPGEDGIFLGRPTLDRDLRGPQDLVFVPRLENSFDLSPAQTLLVGVSGALGPNDTAAQASTQIYGIDLFYKWKPATAHGGWPFVKWQTEAMYRRFEAGRGLADRFIGSETFHDWGVYSQIVWGFYPGWTTGLRGDFIYFKNSSFTDEPSRQNRWRTSANITWTPTEFSKIRLQYNHDFLEANSFQATDSADSLFLQFEFSLGAHGAHKF